MRVVLDTNVLVRATKNATGPARELLRSLESADHVLVLSSFILTELLRVLAYPRVRAMHQLSDEDCHEFVQSLHDAAELVGVTLGSSTAITSDPDDDPVIQTAVHASANVLCTLDRHLRHQRVRDYCKQYGVEVMTDVELLQELRTTDRTSEASE